MFVRVQECLFSDDKVLFVLSSLFTEDASVYCSYVELQLYLLFIPAGESNYHPGVSYDMMVMLSFSVLLFICVLWVIKRK